MAGKGTSFRALEWAWTREISPTGKLVLVNLAGRVDQAYSCFPSARLISEETGLSRATIFRVLARLEADDLILIAHRHRPNGSRRSSRYYLNHDQAPHVTGEAVDDDDIDRESELTEAARRAVRRSQQSAGAQSHAETSPGSHRDTPDSRTVTRLRVAR